MKMIEIECHGVNYLVPNDRPFHCPKVLERHCPTVTSPPNAWHVIHSRLGQAIASGKWDRDAELHYYETEWKELIPHCGQCREHWAELEKRIDWATAESAFGSFFELHNEVSVEYANHEPITYQRACDLYIPQPTIENVIAVTSLAPNQADRVTVCLDSWKQIGFEIHAVQTANELASMRAAYPQVDQWHQCDGDRPTINAMADVATATGQTILIVNADIEMHGSQRVLTEPINAGKHLVGIRWNYDRYWWRSVREQWGLDAFSVTPEQARELPRLDLRIGKPSWDYWLMHHFRNVPSQWIGEPFFFHRQHDLAWSDADWHRNTKILCETYPEIGDVFDRVESSRLRSKFPFSSLENRPQ